MRSKSGASPASPTTFVQIKGWNPRTSSRVSQVVVGDAELTLNMAQINGLYKDATFQESQRSTSGRVASISMMHSATSPTDISPSVDAGVWSSAVGHASTGKSGRVIERLQGDIDKLHRERQVLRMRNEEMEKANENLATKIQYLQDRNDNYEQSHEVSVRQLVRKERQVEDLKDELNREKSKRAKAEEHARLACKSEEEWREQANQAKAIAFQRETEYDMVVSCRNMDKDRHQSGLDKIKDSFETLMRQREEDVEKQKKLEIIAEQQRRTITQLEELTKKLNQNFNTYRSEIDKAIADLRNDTSGNDAAMKQKLRDMTEVTDKMRWALKVDEVVNKNPPRPQVTSPKQSSTENQIEDREPRSPTKTILGFERSGKHRRKASSKASRSKE